MLVLDINEYAIFYLIQNELSCIDYMLFSVLDFSLIYVFVTFGCSFVENLTPIKV